MIRYYSTSTNKFYSSESAAERAEARCNREVIQIHHSNFNSIRRRYLEELAQLQEKYAKTKESVIQTLVNYGAPEEIIDDIRNDGISVKVKVTK